MEQFENAEANPAKKTYHGFHFEEIDLSDADALAARGYDVEKLNKIIEEKSKEYEEKKKND